MEIMYLAHRAQRLRALRDNIPLVSSEKVTTQRAVNSAASWILFVYLAYVLGIQDLHLEFFLSL